MTRTKTDIRNACEQYLQEWDRHSWMQDHGEWASAKWEEERDAYQAAKDTLEEVLQAALDDVERSSSDEVPNIMGAISEARDALIEAAEALDGEVRANEFDYIAEGLIDPDDVSDSATNLEVGYSVQEYGSRKGWSAHRYDDDLYMQWWRNPYGGTSRHHRDLWVLVEEEFFANEESEDEDEG